MARVPMWRRDAKTEKMPGQPSTVRFWFGVVAVALLVLAALGSLLFSHLAYDQNLAERLSSPSLSQPFGTDSLGRDVFARVLAGLLISLGIALVAVIIGATFGVIVGAVAGYYGGFLDALLMRLTDAVLAVPLVLLAISVVAVRGASLVNLVLVIAVTQWMTYARAARGETMVLRGETYVTAARSLGAGNIRILGKHILPQILPTILVLATLGVSEAILLEAGLSFLGLGIQPPDPSLGSLLSEGRQFLNRAPWLGIFPGLVLFLVVFAINSLGDGFRGILDRSRR